MPAVSFFLITIASLNNSLTVSSGSGGSEEAMLLVISEQSALKMPH